MCKYWVRYFLIGNRTFSIVAIWEPLFTVANVFLALCMLPVAEDMILAFEKRAAGVLTTFALGLGFVYVFCVIGFVALRNRYEFGSKYRSQLL